MSAHKTTALVTGASAGMGAEFCRQLADRCELIIGVARRGDRLTALAEELRGRVDLHIVEADLCTLEGVARTVETLRQKGPVDYLVNNAGFSTFGMFEDQLIDGQQDMVTVHINTTMTLCRAAIPFMRELGGGSIINVSSLSAFLPGRGLAVYGASKAFLNYYSQSLQLELAGSGIRVQALCPGYTRTEFHGTEALSEFDTSKIPDDYWMDASVVVSASLSALNGEEVIVVPGAGNLQLAQNGAQQQRDIL
jgi:short-subunit dehydrogenase